jgi:hypothetical protein
MFTLMTCCGVPVALRSALKPAVHVPMVQSRVDPIAFRNKGILVAIRISIERLQSAPHNRCKFLPAMTAPALRKFS